METKPRRSKARGHYQAAGTHRTGRPGAALLTDSLGQAAVLLPSWQDGDRRLWHLSLRTTCCTSRTSRQSSRLSPAPASPLTMVPWRTSSTSRSMPAGSPSSSRDCGAIRTPATRPSPAPRTKRRSNASSAAASGRSCSCLARGGKTYARLRFNTGPGGQIALPVEVDYRRPFAGSDIDAWKAEYKANIHEVAWFDLDDRMLLGPDTAEDGFFYHDNGVLTEAETEAFFASADELEDMPW